MCVERVIKQDGMGSTQYARLTCDGCENKYGFEFSASLVISAETEIIGCEIFCHYSVEFIQTCFTEFRILTKDKDDLSCLPSVLLFTQPCSVRLLYARVAAFTFVLLPV